MRLLSFLSLIESNLTVNQPAYADGWVRCVNYGSGTACFSHARLGLALTLRSCILADGQHNLNASWHGANGELVSNRSFFSGSLGFQWETAAAALLAIMPAPAIPAQVTTETSEPVADPQLISA